MRPDAICIHGNIALGECDSCTTDALTEQLAVALGRNGVDVSNCYDFEDLCSAIDQVRRPV